MVSTIAAAFYMFLLLIVGTLSAFIVYHLYVYSINKKTATLMSVVFLAVLVILLFINIGFFIATDFSAFEISPPPENGAGTATF